MAEDQNPTWWKKTASAATALSPSRPAKRAPDVGAGVGSQPRPRSPQLAKAASHCSRPAGRNTALRSLVTPMVADDSSE